MLGRDIEVEVGEGHRVGAQVAAGEGVKQVGEGVCGGAGSKQVGGQVEHVADQVLGPD